MLLFPKPCVVVSYESNLRLAPLTNRIQVALLIDRSVTYITD